METIFVLLLITLSPVTVVLLPIQESGSQQTSFSSLMDGGGRRIMRLSPSKNKFNANNQYYQTTSSSNIWCTAKSPHELPDGVNICSSCFSICIHTASIQHGQQLLLHNFILVGAGGLENSNMIANMMRYRVSFTFKTFKATVCTYLQRIFNMVSR